MNTLTHKEEIKKVTFISIGVNAFLSIIKMVGGAAFQSNALFVDGIHSLSDIATDFLVLIISKFSREEPDAEHPYGHERFETLGTTALGCVLISVGIIICYENTVALLIGEFSGTPNKLSLVIAFVSVIANEWLFRYTLKTGQKVNSKLVIANAWHSRSDALSSVAVLIGLFLTWIGFDFMDSVVAILVGFMISKVGWDFLWDSIKELVDTSVDFERIDEMKEFIQTIDGVQGLHNLRSRKMGPVAILDLNIEVRPDISVSEGHEIATTVSNRVITKFEEIKDVIVHIDIKDDRKNGVNFTHDTKCYLPLRTEIETKLNALGIEFDKLILHYDNSFIDIELELSKEVDRDEIETKIRKFSWARNISFLQRI
jgi:cation diffusion facilitator family transporter